MKKLRLVFWTLIAAALFAALPAAAAPVSVSISVFHDELAPHGRWVTAASYGSVWVPGGVAAGWEPYVDGEWVYTDYGWTWVADDPWGDVPYHYGTWAFVDPYGWVWIPGTVWAPAWVTWAYTDDYIGWAPVPPTFAVTATGYFGPPVVVSSTRYVFVPTQKFVGVRVASVRVPPQQNRVIVQRAVKTTRYEVGNGVVRVAGPPAARVERALGRPIPRASVDRIRSRPTSLEAAGVARTKSIRVVAPEKERARVASQKERAPVAPQKERAQVAKKSEPKEVRGGPKAEPQRGTSQTEARHEARPAAAPKSVAREKSKSSSSASQPERTTSTRSGVRSEPAVSKSKPEKRPEARAVEPEKPKPQAEKPKPKAEPRSSAARPDESGRRVESQPAAERKRPEPQASASREQPPRPQGEAKAQPNRAPKEKPRPQPKDSPDKQRD